MSDLERAKAYLAEHAECTVVVVRGEEILTGELKGVRPLLKFLEDGVNFRGGAVADRVVGRGAALLHACLNTEKLYAEVMSKPAEEVLRRYGIEYSCGVLTEYIVNRKNDGPCPMEEATRGIFEKEEGLKAIQNKLKELSLK